MGKSIEADGDDVAIDEKRQHKLEKEKRDLLASLDKADFSKQKTRVAYILNLYPEARNSDITLSLRYWETFQADIFNHSGISPRDLFKLERIHYLVRARAKIQNEYNLFTANSAVKRFRRKHEEEMTEEVLADAMPRPVVHVFSDETGKNQDFVIVSSVWVLTGRAVFSVSRAIDEWKAGSEWVDREIHFSRLGRKDADTLRDYLGVIYKNREFLSFKSIAVERAKTKRSIEQVVEKLHEHMLVVGVGHEIDSHRIGLPQSIEVSLDEEQSLDSIALADLKDRVNSGIQRRYGGGVEVARVVAVSSRRSQLIQLADLIAGALNRKLNHRGERGHKDEMADLIVDMLDIRLSDANVDGLDISALFKL